LCTVKVVEQLQNFSLSGLGPCSEAGSVSFQQQFVEMAKTAATFVAQGVTAAGRSKTYKRRGKWKAWQGSMMAC
jgi:hypothetical protein